jgi:N6-adenosine-specific RNA methylase IME4
MDVKLNPEYEKIAKSFPMSREEYDALKESIKKEGLYFPIIVNEEGEILDGYHRYKACQELGIEPKFELKKFPNKLQEKKFVLESMLKRRHLNDFQKAELAFPLLEIEKQLARQRKLSTLKKGEKLPSGSNDHNGEKGRAHEVVAKVVGLSPKTFQRAVKIIEKAPEEIKEKVRKGEMSIAYTYSMVKRREEQQNTPPLPEGVFDVIYADPPWEYYTLLRGYPELHYKTMPTEEICKLRIPTADDAVLFLWATNPTLLDALKVMECWGFKYKTNMVWVKDKIGTGFYFRARHELLLLGIKGKMPAPLEENRPPSVLFSPVRGHSRKPYEVYEIIEKMYPNRKYLELFARPKEERKGWTYWGLEVESSQLYAPN